MGPVFFSLFFLCSLRHVSKLQFIYMKAILATQVYPENDWTGWQNLVNYDVFAEAPRGMST